MLDVSAGSSWSCQLVHGTTLGAGAFTLTRSVLGCYWLFGAWIPCNPQYPLLPYLT